ncbi:TetR/AcrR family transcriptional regulator [Sneathiella glossodoripedis]|uniref:TetR/AcrR family transcriptional regulator n=1 Tax=Sneathiella glossodoripedis TaxID=418853 RepID=UPI00046F9B6C|nr:TetR/AcrR family transcriptional regulator [Sneathiella glossodoripedis]
MARKTGSNAKDTLRALQLAGLQRLYKQGYAGMTLRELAADAGIQAGSIYNHFANKQELLFSVLSLVLNELLEELQDKLKGAENPTAALMSFVECHVIFHSDRRREVQISTSELRSLEPENYRKIVKLRDRYENQLLSILEWGYKEGDWGYLDFRIATKMIIGMMTSVGVWYRPDGPIKQSQIVDIYKSMVSGLLQNDTELLKRKVV